MRQATVRETRGPMETYATPADRYDQWNLTVAAPADLAAMPPFMILRATASDG